MVRVGHSLAHVVSHSWAWCAGSAVWRAVGQASMCELLVTLPSLPPLTFSSLSFPFPLAFPSWPQMSSSKVSVSTSCCSSVGYAVWWDAGFSENASLEIFNPLRTATRSAISLSVPLLLPLNHVSVWGHVGRRTGMPQACEEQESLGACPLGLLNQRWFLGSEGSLN